MTHRALKNQIIHVGREHHMVAAGEVVPPRLVRFANPKLIERLGAARTELSTEPAQSEAAPAPDADEPPAEIVADWDSNKLMDGTVAQVIEWVNGGATVEEIVARARFAKDEEEQRQAGPRSTLIDRLDVAIEAGAESGS